MKTPMTRSAKCIGAGLLTAALALTVLPVQAQAAVEKQLFKSKKGEVIAEFTASDFLGKKEETVTFVEYDANGKPFVQKETIPVNYFRTGSTLQIDVKEGGRKPGDDWGVQYGSYIKSTEFKGAIEIAGFDDMPVGDSYTYPFGNQESGHIEYDEYYSENFIPAGLEIVQLSNFGEPTSENKNETTFYYYRVVNELPEGVTPAKGEKPGKPAAKPQDKPAKQDDLVKSIDAKMIVNGKASSFEAYNIADNNYFKLRDLAQVLSGTEKQFEVSWDSAKNAINLVSGKAYTAVGGELSKADGSAKAAEPNTSKVYLDGKELSLTAYTIGGNNYFKLRDLGQAIDFAVGWDDASSTITVDTAKGYTA